LCVVLCVCVCVCVCVFVFLVGSTALEHSLYIHARVHTRVHEERERLSQTERDRELERLRDTQRDTETQRTKSYSAGGTHPKRCTRNTHTHTHTLTLTTSLTHREAHIEALLTQTR
jgi:hypothetical protein